MKLEQVEQLLEIARVGSLNKAAKNLFISQPNLSTSLSNLEKELNIKIFKRSRKGMALTSEGQQLLNYTTPIYRQFLQVENIVGTLFQDHREIFRISNGYIKFVSNIFIDTLNHFSENELITQYRECAAEKVIDDVSRQLSDIGVLCISSLQKSRLNIFFEFKNVIYTPLMTDQLKVIMRKDHPLALAKVSNITTEMLNQYPIVSYGSLQETLIEEGNLLGLKKSQRSIVVNNRAGMVDIIKKTNAINIGSRSEIPYNHTGFYRDITSLPLENSLFEMELGWICHKNFVHNKSTKFFIETLTHITKNT